MRHYRKKQSGYRGSLVLRLKKTAPKKERQKCGREIIVLFRCFPFLFAACRNFRA